MKTFKEIIEEIKRVTARIEEIQIKIAEPLIQKAFGTIYNLSSETGQLNLEMFELMAYKKALEWVL